MILPKVSQNILGHDNKKRGENNGKDKTRGKTSPTSFSFCNKEFFVMIS